MKKETKRVVLPEGFVKTRFNGYFWHVEEQALYSIKIKGILRKLKKQTDLRQRRLFGPSDDGCGPKEYYYQVSVNGKVYIMTDRYLESLTLASGTLPTDKTKRTGPLGKYDDHPW